MKWVLAALCGAWIVAVGNPAASQGKSVVLYDDAVEVHEKLAEALRRASPRTLRLLPLSERHSGPNPDVVYAIGDRASDSAAHRWPAVPRAELLRWQPATTGPVLYASAHPASDCTARILRERGSHGPWLVVAGPGDDEAAELARALDARLVQGTLAEVSKTLRRLAVPHAQLWVRAHPDHANPAWAAVMQRLAGIPGISVGTDAPGLAHDGVEPWVRGDLQALAEGSLKWTDRARRPRGQLPRTLAFECVEFGTSEVKP